MEGSLQLALSKIDTGSGGAEGKKNKSRRYVFMATMNKTSLSRLADSIDDEMSKLQQPVTIMRERLTQSLSLCDSFFKRNINLTSNGVALQSQITKVHMLPNIVSTSLFSPCHILASIVIWSDMIYRQMLRSKNWNSWSLNLVNNVTK
jgi:hypothetical protein